MRTLKDVTSMGLKVQGGKLYALDQTLLPHEEKWLESATPDDMIEMIKMLRVRGAPLIGVAAAMALAQFARQSTNADQVQNVAKKLREARPTAVNLMAAMDRMMAVVLDSAGSAPLAEKLMDKAEEIFQEDVQLCEDMAMHGESLIRDGDRILTHCNTGGLATVGRGTALGVIAKAHEDGKRIHVYVDETRPLLQGARLTAWELSKLKIPYTLICDNMAASLMAIGKIDRAFVGSDRIARNGDAANKIGTYGVAVMAKFHHVPFYVVAPYTTIDPQCPNGEKIPIEERDPNEVRAGKAPMDAQVFNPAFDVTPANLITAIVTDKGIFEGGKLENI